MGLVFLGLARFAYVMYVWSGRVEPALISVLWAATSIALLGNVLWDLLRKKV